MSEAGLVFTVISPHESMKGVWRECGRREPRGSELRKRYFNMVLHYERLMAELEEDGRVGRNGRRVLPGFRLHVRLSPYQYFGAAMDSVIEANAFQWSQSTMRALSRAATSGR